MIIPSFLSLGLTCPPSIARSNYRKRILSMTRPLNLYLSLFFQSIVFNLIIGTRVKQKVAYADTSTELPLDEIVIVVASHHDTTDTGSLRSQKTTGKLPPVT